MVDLLFTYRNVKSVGTGFCYDYVQNTQKYRDSTISRNRYFEAKRVTHNMLRFKK